MANKIILKKSSVSAKVPLSTDLDVGELAVNLVDQKLYSKKADGSVVLVGSGTGGTGTVTSVGGTGTVNGISLSGTVTSTGNLTLGGALTGVNLTSQVTGTLPVANGGTGNTTAQAEMNRVAGAVTSAQYLRGNGTNVVMSAIQASDVPTLNQNTTGTSSNVTGTVAVANGGTGQTTYTNGQLLIGNTTGGTLAKSTLTAGTGIAVTNGAGAITIAATNNGTVTSVAATVPSFLSVSGSPITTSGTLALSYSGTALPVANGGTGATTAAGALTSLGAYPATNPNGYTTNTGTVTSVGGTGTVNGITLTGSVTSSGNLTLGGTLSGVNLTSQVTGTLPVANGGTGITSLGTGVATFLGTPSSANLAAAVTGETGTGALVFASSPALAGTPTTPTAVAGTNTTQVASTAHVFAERSNTATLTNKTLTSPTITSPSVTGDLSIADKIVHTGDTNTAIRFPTADTVTVETNGAERVRVDSSGNVGIGTSAPAAKLNIAGSLGGVVGGGDSAIKLTNIDSGDFASISAGAPGIVNSGMDFSTNGTRAMYLDVNQRLVVGDTSARYDSTVTLRSPNSYNLVSSKPGTAATGHLLFENDNGAVGTIFTSGTTTAYNTSSDYRLKENVQPMTGALEKVAALNPVTYNWKVDGSAGQGFIAHELQSVVPDAVTGEKDAVDKDGKPQYQGVDTSFLAGILTKAIQELSAKVDTLQAELNTLKGN